MALVTGYFLNNDGESQGKGKKSQKVKSVRETSKNDFNLRLEIADWGCKGMILKNYAFSVGFILKIPKFQYFFASEKKKLLVTKNSLKKNVKKT